MIRLADYVVKKLAEYGVKHVFLVTGGGAMHLNDAFGRSPDIRYVACHHEQACAMAAEGYARVTGQTGVINVTTGPGGINALNGVFGAFTDSIPMVIISGQVKRETCMASYHLPGLRQLGDQEADIIAMVKPITKYAALIQDPESIRYHLERALWLSNSGRPGPCWIDIPVDVQGALIDGDKLRGYDPAEDAFNWDVSFLRGQCRQVVERLMSSQRPVILAGTGVRLAGALDVFQRVIRKLGIPVATAWTHDLLASDDPVFCGRQGSIGERAGNFTVQNSDMVLVLGSRLCIRQVSYNWKAFARHAYKIQVDIDAAELNKPTVHVDMPIHCDAKWFLEELERQVDAAAYDPARHEGWLAWCKQRVAKYPVVLPKHRVFNGLINPYHFIEVLFSRLSQGDVVVCGNATACIVPFQAGKLQLGQRLFSNSGSASMGFDLPAAIGAAVALGGKRVICLAGEGSIQMNLQEMQTVMHHRLPIKIFVLNNGGYLSIRSTQKNFFNHMVGSDAGSGVSFPDMVRIANAYGMDAQLIACEDFRGLIDNALASEGPHLSEVMLDGAQTFEPRLSSRKLADGSMATAPLDDMFPFLERDEYAANQFIAEG